MAFTELIKDRRELRNIADTLRREIAGRGDDIVSRYMREVTDTVCFVNGRCSGGSFFKSCVSNEMMQQGIYTNAAIDDLGPHNTDEIAVAREQQKHRFNFHPKGIALPRTEEDYVENIPCEIAHFDDELREFTRRHANTRLTRVLTVEQKVIVNSWGGAVIQSIPYFAIYYSHGYNPIPVTRDLCTVCTSEEDVRSFTALIKYMPDPTPDGKIRNSKTFTEAFENLLSISRLKAGSLEEAGIPLSTLYDVVILNGVPIHEIFGHHFEEPIRHLDSGESATFKSGQDISNNRIVLTDNPMQLIEGFRPLGFTYADAYGRIRVKTTHINEGRIQDFLGSEYGDPDNLGKFLNTEKQYVGSASQHIDGQFPQARMSCTVLDGKSEQVDLEGMIVIAGHSGAETDPRYKTYLVKSQECYVIRNGVPVRVIPLQISGGINQALADMSLLDSWTYQIGVCEKPEPLYYPQSRGGAQNPSSQFAKSQVWRRQQVYPLQISDAHLRVLCGAR